MCTVCGCETTVLADAPKSRRGVAVHAHGHSHGFKHLHYHANELIDFGKGPAGVSIPGMSQQRVISIERDLLAKNDTFAAANRKFFREAKVLALNFVSSPGSGKTSLLVRAIDNLKMLWPIAVIEGDQQTSRNSERIRSTGAQAVQINTGKSCHLDAHMVANALEHVAAIPGGLLFIKNVGNLVCPAAYDLGEAAKVVVLSVTEGEDTPLKYPDMFAAADLLLLNKADLLPYLDFDKEACVAAALRVNPDIQILTISAKTGEGLAAFYAWIAACTVAAHAKAVVE